MTKSLSMMILAALAAPVSASDESSDQELVSASDHATDDNAAPQLRDGDEQDTTGEEQVHMFVGKTKPLKPLPAAGLAFPGLWKLLAEQAGEFRWWLKAGRLQDRADQKTWKGTGLKKF